MESLPFTPDPLLNYLISCNLALSVFLLFKIFRFEKKVCNEITQIVTAFKMKFPELKDIFK